MITRSALKDILFDERARTNIGKVTKVIAGAIHHIRCLDGANASICRKSGPAHIGSQTTLFLSFAFEFMRSQIEIKFVFHLKDNVAGAAEFGRSGILFFLPLGLPLGFPDWPSLKRVATGGLLKPTSKVSGGGSVNFLLGRVPLSKVITHARLSFGVIH